MTTQTTEYRVKWKRKGLAPKRKRYASLKPALRFASLLTSDKAWELFGLEPDDRQCCSGYECGCGGITVREHFQRRNAELPTIEYVLIEQRAVGEWTFSKDQP